MSDKIPNHIGSVKVSNLGVDNREYVDAAEPELLRIFTSDDPDAEREAALKNNPSWPLFYHLSPSRKNVVSWIDFKPGSRILEVGAGCGSITESLVTRDVFVVANDISWKRCEINAHRNKDAENLEVVVGNLESYKPEQKFDYVVCVGVLEYAGSFITGDNPYEDFVVYMKSFLKPGGTLVLAIENKLGFKYLSGSKEDHTGKLFDGINNYLYTEKKVRTFGRKELQSLLTTSFREIDFFYPYPDYKLPSVVFSEEYYPGEGTRLPLGALPTPNPDQAKYPLFNEKLFFHSIQQNDLFRDMSNSFIVLASDSSTNQSLLFGYFQMQRPLRRRVETKVLHGEDGERYVLKQAFEDGGRKLLQHLVSNQAYLSGKLGDSIFVPKPTKNDKDMVSIPFISGVTLESKLENLIISKDVEGIAELLLEFEKRIMKIDNSKLNPSEQAEYAKVFGDAYAEKITCSIGSADMNFDNFIVNDQDDWVFFDYEWTYQFSIPTHYIIGRAFMWELLGRYGDLMHVLAEDDESATEVAGIKLPGAIYDACEAYFKPEAFAKIIKTESAFQSSVTNKDVDVLDLLNTPVELLDIEELLKLIDTTSELHKQSKALQADLDATKKAHQDTASELDSIKNSRSYRAVQKIKKPISRSQN